MNYLKYRTIRDDPSRIIYKKYKNWPWAENMKFLESFPNKRISKILKKGVDGGCTESFNGESTIYNQLTYTDNDVSNNEDLKCNFKSKFSHEFKEFLNVNENNLIQDQVFVIENATSEENWDGHVENIKLIVQSDDDHNPKKRKLKPDLRRNKINESYEIEEDTFKKLECCRKAYDETEHFFMGYAQTFKKMPVKLQRVLRLEMMTLFARYELQSDSFETNEKQKKTKRN